MVLFQVVRGVRTSSSVHFIYGRLYSIVTTEVRSPAFIVVGTTTAIQPVWNRICDRIRPPIGTILLALQTYFSLAANLLSEIQSFLIFQTVVQKFCSCGTGES